MKPHLGKAPSPDKSLQRPGAHKVPGRGRPSREHTRALRARVLKWRCAAAEVGRQAPGMYRLFDGISAVRPRLKERLP